MHTLFATTRIERGGGPPTELPSDLKDLGKIEFPNALGGTSTIAELVQAPESDAFLVAKDGVLLTEHYANGMQRSSLHLINSISKSYLGMLAGTLVDAGTLQPDRLVRDYLPGLNTEVFAHTKVHHLLNMTAAVKAGEDYDDPSDDFWVEASTVGWRPELKALTAAESLRAYAELRTEAQQADDEAFNYRTHLTNLLALTLEQAAGEPLPALFERQLWSRLGCDQDCRIVTDPTGFPYFGAGMNVCARDLIRFGLLLLNDGHYNGQTIIPSAWIQATLAGSDTLRSLFAASPVGEVLTGGHYSNQLWANAEAGVLICIGIHGQFVFINRDTNVVIVKLSSHPKPADPVFLTNCFSALTTLSLALG